MGLKDTVIFLEEEVLSMALRVGEELAGSQPGGAQQTEGFRG